ncbi:hypothetical protein HYC85_014141 [Camellia sinensis]|uniref:SAP domain-containing protein n=1 Tax=Camellia sinensis TaxID=4442 RepID=A0A7J7H8M4_CAMSI|nr:hypothetical protein HYC85_014141 [Camellia sinensis]
MANLLTSSPLPLSFSYPSSPAQFAFSTSRNVIVLASVVSSPGRKTRRKKQQQQHPNDDAASMTASTAEKGLRLVFMEELMGRARNRDVSGVSEVIYDMIAAGLSPGPRSFHGLIVSHVLSADDEGAMHALRRELSEGIRPLHETFVALIRLFGSKGCATRGLEILAAMEKLHFNIRQAWLVLVEELIRNNHLEDANKVFLKGAEGGLRATNELYDLLIEEDCRVGDHSNALTIAYEMEAAGRMATTFHFNCLLSVQATCGIPEIAFATFENMEYGEDHMKPDTETYNWVIQAYTRAESYDRLLVECFTKYCVVREAIRHFRGLKNFVGGTKVLHNDGKYGDPLSLYLRALCREVFIYEKSWKVVKILVALRRTVEGYSNGDYELFLFRRIVELLEALEAMARDKQRIPPRAMIVSRKYRTLVSSWIEPLHEEAEIGYEIDYIARYIAEGGLTGERKRWVPRRGKAPLDPDALGFVYNYPIEASFKQRCLDDWKVHHRKLLKTLRNEGPSALGVVSEYDYIRVEERLRNIIKGPDQNALKPKAASKMIVSELKEELEAQGLPTDGTRNVLYQRVQKARRINRSRGRPLWVPPVEEEEEEVDEELDELISRIKLEEGNTEFWKRRFLGEGLNNDHDRPIELNKSEDIDVRDDTTDVEDVVKEVEDEEADEEEEDVEQTEIQVGDRVKDKEVEAAKPLQMIGVQLLKDSDMTASTTRKSKKKLSRISMEDDADDDWFPEDIYEAFKELRNRKVFDVSDMYTIADAWGWTWEKELKNKTPQRWSQQWEVELAVKVIELGGTPTIGDCAMILRAAIRTPMPSAFLKILQTSHSLGYIFGSPLYDEIITLCVDLGELDAAVAIVADLESSGITVPDETLDRVISARQVADNDVDDAS